jgi:formate hydrogenlyase subunit 3/multisubunit Na+/H+ antiporter MnhD subunit
VTVIQCLRALLNFSQGFPILDPLMAGPLPLIILPLAMAPIVYFLQRWPTAASLSASVTALVTAGLCLHLPLNDPTYVLGRELVLDHPSQMVVVFILVTAAVLFLCTWFTSQSPSLPFDGVYPEQGQRAQDRRQAVVVSLSNRQDTAFIPFGLIILSLLSGAATMRLFLFAALFLEIAAIVAVFAIHGDQMCPERVACPEHSRREGQGSTRPALRYLVMTALALPCFLVAAWLFDLHARNPHNVALAEPALTLLVLGFAISLGAVPFQAWLPAVAVEAPPMVTAFLIGTVNPVLLLLLTSLFQQHPWLIADNQAFQLLTVGGLSTALVGGVLALGQQDFGRLLAYAALSDLGCLLLGLGTASIEGLTATALQLVNRSLALVLAGVGLAALRRYASSDAFADLGNVGRRMPLVSAGLLAGLLSLAGFPLTGGFASRWPIYRLVYQKNHLYAIALFLSGGAAALSCWRGLLALLGPDAHPESEHEPIPRLRYLPTAAVMLILTLLCLALGLFPRLFLPPILKLAEGFTFLGSPR